MTAKREIKFAAEYDPAMRFSPISLPRAVVRYSLDFQCYDFSRSRFVQADVL